MADDKKTPKETLAELSERVSKNNERIDQNFMAIQQQNAQFNQALGNIQRNMAGMTQQLAARTVREKALALAIESYNTNCSVTPASNDSLIERAGLFETFLLGPPPDIAPPAEPPSTPAPPEAGGQ